MFKYSLLHKFGVEIEGSFARGSTARGGVPGWKMVSDGSLSGLPDMAEMVSTPRPVTESGINALLAELDNVYPDNTNSTCGIHVHFSSKLPPVILGALVGTLKFQNYMMDGLIAWGKRVGVNEGSAFYRRLGGENDRYCKILTEEPSVKSEDRYVAVNLQAHRKHGTIEFRVLPAFQSKKLACQAIFMVLKLVHDYLAENYASLPCPVSDTLDMVEGDEPLDLGENVTELDCGIGPLPEYVSSLTIARNTDALILEEI